MTYLLLHLLVLVPYLLWVRPILRHDAKLYREALREIQQASIFQKQLPAGDARLAHSRKLVETVALFSVGTLVYFILLSILFDQWQ